MKSAEYNVQEIRAGRVSAEQLSAFVDANKIVEAVKALQSHKGLKADGRLTPETLAALEPPKPAKKPAKKDDGWVDLKDVGEK